MREFHQKHEVVLVPPTLEPDRVGDCVDEPSRVRKDDVNGHALRAHLLVHDFGAVERLQRGVDEAEREAKRKFMAIVACAPLTFVFPACPNLDESAATIARRTASRRQPT